MKIRSDSLFAELARQGKLDDFCAWIAAERPSYSDMQKRIDSIGLTASLGALHNFVTFHLHQWRVQRALDQAASEKLELPENMDAETRDRIKALKLDLAMRDISVDQQLTLVRLEQDAEKNDLAARRLAILEKREAQAKDVVADKTISDEDRMKKIKELFGAK